MTAEHLPHVDRLAADLDAALGALMVDLAALRVPASGRGQGGTRATAPGIPGGVARLNLLDATARTLHRACRLVIAGRGLRGRVGATAARQARWLRPHAEWLAAHGDLEASAIITLAGAVRRATAPEPVNRTPVAPCPVSGCQGRLWAHLETSRPTRTLGAAWTTQTEEATPVPPVRCDATPDHAWAATDPRLAALVGVDGPERMSISEFRQWISDRWGREVPDSTVRAWTRRNPDTIRWDARTGTLDRVAATMRWTQTWAS